MAVEQARPSESRPAQAAASSGPARQRAADAGEDTSAGSFMALLGAADIGMGAEEGAAPAAGDPLAGPADARGRRDTKGKALHAQPGVDAGTPPDAALLLAQSLAAAQGAGDSGQVLPSTAAGVMTDAETGAIDANGKSSTASRKGLHAGTGAQAADAAASSGTGKGVPGELAAAEGTRAGAATAFKAQAGHAAMQAQSQQAAARDTQQAAQAIAAQNVAAADARALAGDAQANAIQRAGGEPQNALAAAAIAAPAMATTDFNPARRLERETAGTTGAAGTGPSNTADSMWNRHALLPDAAAPVATAQIDTGGASMEDRMAAQVSYWLSQKTQSAEMTLNTLDGTPVEVRISMTGNEAQVAFRSDTGATREMLGSAIGQLHDLLGSEGVVLSGVTVNDFGARPQGGSTDDGERQQGRSGMRQVSAAPDTSVPVRAAVGAAGGAPGRAVDLYV